MSSTDSILLIGSGGMLGRAWQQMLDQKGQSYHAISRSELDLADPKNLDAVIGEGVKMVINCGAYTDVDGAESDEALANQINGESVGILGQRCQAVGATLVHYSTDYVFNGQQTQPYATDQPHDPINAYGRSKALGETRLRESGANHLIFRTSWLYAPWGKNFVLTIAKAAAQRDTLRVVDDQLGRPTSCEHLAKSSCALIQAGATGTYHITDGGQCTWHAFASMIAAHANPACTVEPCSSEEYPRPAVRPAYSVLDLSRTEARIGPMSDWKTNLANVLDRLAQPTNIK